MGYPPTGPYPAPSRIYCDNEAARVKSLVEHAGRFEVTKCVKASIPHAAPVQNPRLIHEGAVRVIWCPWSATHQWADVLTKNCAVKHTICRGRAGLTDEGTKDLVDPLVVCMPGTIYIGPRACDEVTATGL